MTPKTVMKRERWKDIPGYKGRYQVSDRGRVRSLSRLVRTISKHDTESRRLVKGRLLRPQRHSQNYLHVTLHDRTCLIHSLVLLAFVGPRPRRHETAHRDGRKHNNCLSNLRYATSLENHDDRRKHGTTGKGEKNRGAKLRARDVRAIRRLTKTTQVADIATRYGIHPHHVTRLARRERWVHVR